MIWGWHPLTRRRPIIEKWTGEEYDDMEAEFDNIDTNEGGMILFQVNTFWIIFNNFFVYHFK